MANERVISDIDIASSLSQMAESTTAAELVRTQGQTKKVKVLSERKLKDWLQALLNQHLAAKEDSFSDQEKEALLRKTQEELARRIQREQTADAERNRIQAELAQVMAQISANQGDQTGLDEALLALKARLAEVEGLNSDLQQDAYDLQDQLQEKLNLLSSTIAEKDRMRDAVRNQMLRSNALVEGVVGLDAHYYAGRHQDENPVSDEASDDERFYHDFDVGALIIQTLSQDLEKLRSITGKLGDDAGDQRSLEQDLDLLTQVKSGSLHAMDVAAPIGGLIEALGGARAEAESLSDAVAHATGGAAQQISELPDAEGDPAEVIAGATAIARELAAALARDRQRIAALQNLADDADTARNDTENELEKLREDHRLTLEALAASQTELAQAQQAQTQSGAMADQQRALARSVIAAAQGDDRLADTAADLALGLDDDQQPAEEFAEQVARAVAELTARKHELARELADAHATTAKLRVEADEIALAAEQQAETAAQRERESAQHRALATAAADEATTAAARVEHMRRELDEALAQVRVAQEESDAAKADAAEAITKARTLETKHADRIRTDRILAGELLQVAKKDDLLADVTTDLSVALDDDSGANDLQQQLGKTVSALAQRQESLTAEYTRIGRDSERMRAEVGEAKQALADTQRSVVHALIQAGKDDADLQESVSQLEWALERMRPGEPMPGDLLQILDGALAKLASRKQTLQSERDEMALNGKEIISALTTTRDQRELEFRELRAAYDDTSAYLATIESRTVAAESANRQLAEALSKAAQVLPIEAEETRIDLELALSQLPDEGEEGIDVPADVSAQIAAHGSRVAIALADRQQQVTAALARADADRQRLEQELANRTTSVERLNSEVAGLHQELTDIRALHATTEARASTLRSELDRVQSEAAAAAKAVTEARDELDHASERELAQADELALRTAEIDGFRVRIANLDKQLTHSQAELAEHHARGGASADSLREDLQAARRDLAIERETLKARETEIQELREKSESAEARLKRLREEFGKRLEERDLLLQQKDRQLDEIADHKMDLSGLQSQIQALNNQLTQAHTRIGELEAQSGVAAGATGRHTNAGAELKRTQADRDLLREQKRSLEADLAESASRVDELTSQCEQLRKEMLAIREQVEKTLHDERSKSTSLRDENGRLKADNAGLQQRIRKLSGE